MMGTYLGGARYFRVKYMAPEFHQCQTQHIVAKRWTKKNDEGVESHGLVPT